MKGHQCGRLPTVQGRERCVDDAPSLLIDHYFFLASLMTALAALKASLVCIIALPD
jgi:hypothetical protein